MLYNYLDSIKDILGPSEKYLNRHRYDLMLLLETEKTLIKEKNTFLKFKIDLNDIILKWKPDTQSKSDLLNSIKLLMDKNEK